ncbi:MAG: hypothetical protein R3D32_09335 [Nitratireductor sp.]
MRQHCRAIPPIGKSDHCFASKAIPLAHYEHYWWTSIFSVAQNAKNPATICVTGFLEKAKQLLREDDDRAGFLLPPGAFAGWVFGLRGPFVRKIRGVKDPGQFDWFAYVGLRISVSVGSQTAASPLGRTHFAMRLFQGSGFAPNCRL